MSANATTSTLLSSSRPSLVGMIGSIAAAAAFGIGAYLGARTVHEQQRREQSRSSSSSSTPTPIAPIAARPTTPAAATLAPNPQIVALASAFPPNQYSQTQYLEAFISNHSMRKEDEEFTRRVWAGTKIETSYSYLPVTDLFRKMTRTEYVKYIKPSLLDLSLRSSRDALAQWLPQGGDVSKITHIVFGTMTGSIHAPTMDTQIALALGLQPNIKRLNVEGMGCLTGYRCLGLANDIVRGDPTAVVLLVVCDIRSALGNQLSKLAPGTPVDKSNVIVSSLFRDSGAAAIITGSASSSSLSSQSSSAPPKPLYEIVAHRSMLIPDSIHLARYTEHDDAVIHLFLDKELPNAVGRVLHSEVSAMIAPYGLKPEDCSYSVHTGGPRVLNNVQHALHIPVERLAASWYCMKKYGNLSGSSNLVVLDHWRKLDASVIPHDAREYTVGVSFGPGVGMELVLLRGISVPFNKA